jgi:hypothetical protein
MVYGSMERETAELKIVDLPVELMDAEAGVVVPVKSSVDVSVQVVKFRRIERQDFYISRPFIVSQITIRFTPI